MDVSIYSLHVVYVSIRLTETIVGEFPQVDPNPLLRDAFDLANRIYNELQKASAKINTLEWTIVGEIKFAGSLGVVLVREDTFWVAAIYCYDERRTEILASYVQLTGGKIDLVNPKKPYIYYLLTPDHLARFVKFVQAWEDKKIIVSPWNDYPAAYN